MSPRPEIRVSRRQQVSEIRSKGVRLQVACDRLGISLRTGERLLAEGRFPIPELPRLTKKRGSPHLFSTVHIDDYLRTASLAWGR